MNPRNRAQLPLSEPSETEIQKVAYRLWTERGCPAGIETENGFAAKEWIRHHHGRRHMGPPQKAEIPSVHPQN
jgi:hypothetical protein